MFVLFKQIAHTYTHHTHTQYNASLIFNCLVLVRKTKDVPEHLNKNDP